MEQHGSDTAVITGSSTHNEGVEILWRDVFWGVGVLFYNTFQQLQDDDQLTCIVFIMFFYLGLT